MKALKDEFRARGLKQAIGEMTEVTAVEQTANRLDTAKVRAFFGSAIAKYETPIVSTVIRVRPALSRLGALIAGIIGVATSISIIRRSGPVRRKRKGK